MRDTHKLKEKYELSLDNSQIVTLTVASLVVLGGVFMLGVVVGKKLSGEQVEKAPGDLLSQLDQKTNALDSLKDHDASTLTFQDELTKKTPEVVAAAPKKPEEKKPVEKPAEKPSEVARVEPPLPQAVMPSEVVKPPDEPKSVAALEAKLPDSPPKSEPVATRTHDGGGLKEAFGKVQRQAPEAAADGNWTIQLSAYQDRAEADRFAAGLRDKGYAPYIVEAQVANKGTWFRVRMGRFPSKDAASRYLDDFKRETSMNAIVAPAN